MRLAANAASPSMPLGPSPEPYYRPSHPNYDSIIGPIRKNIFQSMRGRISDFRQRSQRAD
jgi:hypothetical protein